jgi:hypothetical protein
VPRAIDSRSGDSLASTCGALPELVYFGGNETFACNSKCMKNITSNKKELSPKQREELLAALKARFE